MIAIFHFGGSLADLTRVLLGFRSRVSATSYHGETFGAAEIEASARGQLAAIPGVTLFPGPTTPLRAEHVSLLAKANVSCPVGAPLRDAIAALHTKSSAWFFDPDLF